MYPIPDLKLSWNLDSPPHNGSTIAMATFMGSSQATSSPSKVSDNSSPSKIVPKLLLRIPFTLRGNYTIVGYTTKYISLFDDTPRDTMDTARTLQASFPVIISNLISKPATGSTTATYINVTKATRIIKIITPQDQDFDDGIRILLGDGVICNITKQMIEQQAQQKAADDTMTFTQRLPNTPPSNLFKRPVAAILSSQAEALEIPKSNPETTTIQPKLKKKKN
jgi:hypothetical protein